MGSDIKEKIVCAASLNDLDESQVKRLLDIGRKMPSMTWFYSHEKSLGCCPRDALDAGRIAEVEYLLGIALAVPADLGSDVGTNEMALPEGLPPIPFSELVYVGSHILSEGIFEGWSAYKGDSKWTHGVWCAPTSEESLLHFCVYKNSAVCLTKKS